MESWPAHNLISQMWDLCNFTNVSQLTHRELTTNSQCHLIYLCRDELGVQHQNDVTLKYFMWDSWEYIMISPWHHCEIKFFTGNTPVSDCKMGSLTTKGPLYTWSKHHLSTFIIIMSFLINHASAPFTIFFNFGCIFFAYTLYKLPSLVQVHPAGVLLPTRV